MVKETKVTFLFHSGAQSELQQVFLGVVICSTCDWLIKYLLKQQNILEIQVLSLLFNCVFKNSILSSSEETQVVSLGYFVS